jgi:hypothetical protein
MSDDAVTNPENPRPRRPGMGAKAAVTQITNAIELRMGAIEKSVVQLHENHGEVADRLERLEESGKQSARDSASTMGGLIIELQTIRKALYQNNMITAEANAQCDEAWQGVETPWPTAMETAETEPLIGTEAQRRATAPALPFMPRARRPSD